MWHRPIAEYTVGHICRKKKWNGVCRNRRRRQCRREMCGFGINFLLGRFNGTRTELQ